MNENIFYITSGKALLCMVNLIFSPIICKKKNKNVIRKNIMLKM